jgi:peptidyl-prolyl cis-trans isomerase SurA
MRFRLLRRVPAAIVCASLTAACADRVPPPPGPDVWAVVDGREIRKDDVERAYRRIAPLAPVPSADEALTAKLRILNDLIDQDILLGRAGALKVQPTDAEVEKAFGERKSNMPEEAFQRELAQRGLTADDMKRSLRRELTVQKLLEQEVGSKSVIDDEAIRQFYEQNRAQFNVTETRYRIAQIVVTVGRDRQIRNRANDDATTPEEAQRKVQMLMGRLKSGADFATLAREQSEDPQSAPQGGDLGFVPVSALSQVAPALRRAVLNARPGDVTLVSADDRGAYTLVLLVAREEAGQRDLSTPGVREGITNALRERKEQLLTTAYLAAARNDVRVVNYLARQVVDARGSQPGLAPSPPDRQ